MPESIRKLSKDNFASEEEYGAYLLREKLLSINRAIGLEKEKEK